MKRRRWLRWIAVVFVAIVIAAAGFVWWLLAGTYAVDRDVDLPARFSWGLIYMEPVTTSGEKMSLLADTGGGLFLTSACAKRCGVATLSLPGGERGRLPSFRPNAWIPETTGAEKWMAVSEGSGDGMLGQRWFAGGVWTIDYPAQKFILRHTPFAPTPEMARCAEPLGFRREWGMITAHHPRIVVSVAGEPFDALLDTGATVWLSPEALQAAVDDGPVERGTSFVSESFFRHWQEAHPDWRIIENGCAKSKQAIIIVPEVEVGGIKAGPVWFTRRGDGNYTWMSTFMDRPIRASIGGSFLKHFRVTIDYPKATAWFEKID